MQSSFLLYWAAHIQLPGIAIWKSIPQHAFAKLGHNLTFFQANVSANQFKGIEVIKSFFWRQVLTCWLENQNSFRTEEVIFKTGYKLELLMCGTRMRMVACCRLANYVRKWVMAQHTCFNTEYYTQHFTHGTLTLTMKTQKVVHPKEM